MARRHRVEGGLEHFGYYHPRDNSVSVSTQTNIEFLAVRELLDEGDVAGWSQEAGQWGPDISWRE